MMTAVILFINCAANSHSKVIVSPDFKKYPLISATLALVIIDEKPEVIYNGSLQRAFGRREDAEKLAREFFQSRLLTDLNREVDIKNTFASYPPPRHLVTKEAVNRENETVTVEIPIEGTKLEFGKTKVDLVLLLSSVRIGTETDEYYHSRVDHGLNTRIGRHLIYIANFVLWDNTAQSYICYGRVKSRVPIRGEESVITEWEEVSKQFVRTIFEPTGFLKRTKNR